MSVLEILTQCVWKGSVLLCAGFAINGLLRRRSAALRHTVWVVCLAAMLLLPLAVVRLPRWAVLGRQQTITVAAAPLPAATVEVSVTPATAVPTPLNVPLAIWASGAGLAAAWFLAGILATAWMVRRATPFGAATDFARSLGITRRVRLLSSRAARMPLTWGILRPVVVLPPGAAEWPEPRLRAVLLHELVHVRRFDLLAQAAGQLACCLYWFHPLAWMAARRLRIEREQACDDAVLAHGIPAPEYAGHLMDLVRSMSAAPAWTQSLAMAEASGLESRVRAMLDSKRDRRTLNGWKTAAIASAAIAALLPLAALSQTHPRVVTLPPAMPIGAMAAAAEPAPPPPPPQAFGSITGVVKDPSGAVVPGVAVIAHIEGAADQNTVSDAVGQFRFPSLLAGHYTVEVKAPGFTIFRAPVSIGAGSVAQVNANLSVGAATETVTVKGVRSAFVAPVPAPAPQGRIRVGGNVQPARIVRQPRPEYPAELQQAGIEGTVVLRAVISKAGEPISIQVVGTGVDQRLAAAAAKAVAQWRYSPALLNGEPVETMVTIDLAFTLDQ
jgi:TonB family protein